MEELERRLSQPLLMQIVPHLPKDVPIYLVGGAVRDALLGRANYDLDFVTGPEAMKIARRLADEMGAAYYPLDTERRVARLVFRMADRNVTGNNLPIRVDFSAYQGPDLMSDLYGRDITINAMAVETRRLDTLVDPLNGAADLAAKRLRACSPASFSQDPIRVLRAVRFSVNLGLKILPESLQGMREATPELTQVSAERVRDELFRILGTSRPATSLRILDNLEALKYFFPEFEQLKTVEQSAPHIWDAFNHTLELLERLEDVLDVLRIDYDPEKAENLLMGMAVMKLGRYRKQLAEHFSISLNPDRPHRGLLFLAGLYHDVGKKSTRTVDSHGKTRFIGHETAGKEMVRERGEELKLANNEIDRLVTIVNHHMRPSLLSHTGVSPSRKAIYRFFRDTGAAGIDICIISLADMLATYGPTLPQERWAWHLEVVRCLMEAWWEDKDGQVSPPPVINGSELIQALGLTAGPMVGYLLEGIKEAQVSQEIHTRDEAIRLAEGLLKEYIENGPAVDGQPVKSD